jgi:hypothetical protein
LDLTQGSFVKLFYNLTSFQITTFSVWNTWIPHTTLSGIGVVIFILADWLSESVTPIAIKTTDIAMAQNIFFIVVILFKSN